MSIWEGDSPGTTILLTSYCVTYCPRLALEDTAYGTSASKPVLFLALDGVTYFGFFLSLYQLQGGCLLEMTSMTSAGALRFIHIKGQELLLTPYESSVLPNYSFLNNSCISIYVLISHHCHLS